MGLRRVTESGAALSQDLYVIHMPVTVGRALQGSRGRTAGLALKAQQSQRSVLGSDGQLAGVGSAL